MDKVKSVRVESVVIDRLDKLARHWHVSRPAAATMLIMGSDGTMPRGIDNTEISSLLKEGKNYG